MSPAEGLAGREAVFPFLIAAALTAVVTSESEDKLDDDENALPRSLALLIRM